VNAQIKVDTNGKVGLHTSTTSASSDVLVYGDMQFANIDGTVLNIMHGSSTPIIISPATATTGAIGTASLPFYCLYAYYVRGYELYTTYGSYHASDQKLKENFRSIDNPLEKILQMNGKKYDYIADQFDTIGTKTEQQERAAIKKDKLGFVAQELKEIVPEAVVYKEDEDLYYIDYDAIIPVIVEAMKEQQATIEGQQTTIEKLTARIETLEGNSPNEKSATIDGTTPASLNQNIPNPFSENTTINMYLPNTVSRATLYIYNMQGEQIKYIAVNERGNTSVTIEGHTLKAGMYLYTLIADGKEVDTKKMILTK
jgi:hypothetical protein